MAAMRTPQQSTRPTSPASAPQSLSPPSRVTPDRRRQPAPGTTNPKEHSLSEAKQSANLLGAAGGLLERVRARDDVEAVLPHADPLDVRAQQLLDAQHVLLRGQRQLFERLALGDVLLPAVHLLVLDHRLVQQLQVGRHAVQLLALVPVGHADLDLLEPREHVQLGQVDLREAVHEVRVAHLRDVEPAAAARATSGRAELGADAAQVLAHVVRELRRERALAHARAVSLDDPNDAVEAVGRDAAARAHAADARVGRRDVGVRAKVNVEHGGVGTLDEDALAGDVRVVEVRDRVDRHGEDAVLDAAVELELGVHVHLQVRVVVLVELDLVAQLVTEVVEVAQVAHAHAVAQHLGRVGRADALLGRADLVAAATLLVEPVHLLVQVQHHVRAVRDEDAALVVHAHVAQLLELGQQARQVHHDAVADDADGVRVEDARRHQVELVLLALVHDRVPGVRAAGHARDHVVVLRQVVHELALAFVAPLRAEHHVHARVQAVVVPPRSLALSGTRHTMDEFLAECEKSGDAAYGELRSLLDRLEDPNTRAQARIFLSQLQKRFNGNDPDNCLRTYHFLIQDFFLHQFEGYEKQKKLTMMVIPSIFVPEDWSFTFYEGLNRNPDTIFKDKTVAELGCGNGWISIAIAKNWSPLKVYGLDINPRAVKISWINLYLNSLDENGQPIYDEEGKTLLDRVEFYESDLLSYCRDHRMELERIVGCIPQILNPNPDAMSKMITENASEEFLHSLSNYCALQGFVEDQFGLGLIARAVEEGISVIKPLGIMIFNMGGRPGQGVCQRLFARRGLLVDKLWQTKILQAADTDISALVEIEKNSPHRFEFFMGLAGDQPICARTAWAYGKAGGRISHALSVYSCQLRQPNKVKMIFDFLKNGFHDISNSLDLSFEDDAVADEKIPFLAYLASVLKRNSFFPYEPPAGSKRFRDLIAGFMKTYHHVPLSTDNVVVFPSRAVAIENALRLFSPQLAIVDEHLTQHLPQHWLTSLAIESTESVKLLENVITVIEAPRQSDLMIELIKKLRPQVVITGMAQFEAITCSAFQHLLDTTREIGSRLFIDISDQFELSSLPSSNGVLKYLSGTSLPSHAAIICGLLKNRVYSDLEVAFMISEDESIFNALSKTVELLEGAIAAISQYYYGCLFHDLLAFQLSDRHPPAEREVEKVKADEMIGFSSSVTSVLEHAEFSVTETDNSSVVHMDVDQNLLPIPSPVKAAIFESFARQNIAESELDVTTSISQYVKSHYGFQTTSDTEYIYADCSTPLFNKLVLCCIQEGGTLCFPSGSNGNYVSSARFLKANVATIPTQCEGGFKLTESALTSVFETLNKPWVYITGPTISPTGLIYTNEDMESILTTCAKFGARVIIDTSFSGLKFDPKGWGGWDLESILAKLNSSAKSTFCLSLLGGLSLQMLAGGLKFGFLVLNQPLLAETFHSLGGLSKPHCTVKYTVKKLLDLWEQKAEGLVDAVAERAKLLENRSKRLKETLENCGWEVLESCAGVSMVAKPSAYIGKCISLKENAVYEAELKDSNIREAMLKATGLCINSESWTGIPGYCRFTITLEDDGFERALDCIAKFKQVITT